MPTELASVAHHVGSFPSVDCSSPADPVLGLEEMRRTFQNWVLKRTEPTAVEFRAAVASAAEQVACAPRLRAGDLLADHIDQILTEIGRMGSSPQGGAEAIERADSLAQQGWTGVLGAMLLTPAWRWTGAPLLSALPAWMWGMYTAWLFMPPGEFSEAGDAERFVAHVTKHLDELARWADRNAGSAGVRAAIERYLPLADALPFDSSRSPMRKTAELHAKLLTRFSRCAFVSDSNVRFKKGRRLRVGFVASRIEAIPDIARSLDSLRFDVVQLVLESPEGHRVGEKDRLMEAIHSAARRSISREAQVVVLPETMADQLEVIASHELDVVIFTERLTCTTHAVTRLASHRTAALQAVIGADYMTTGLATIDLFIAPSLAAFDGMVDQFSERVALVPGIGIPLVAPSSADKVAIRRSEIGLPEHGILLISAGRISQFSPELIDQWLAALKGCPEAIIAIQLLFTDDRATGGIDHLTRRIHAQGVRAGVTSDRIRFLHAAVENLGELRDVLAVADIYLDPEPAGDLEPLSMALAAGVPSVVREGSTLRSKVPAMMVRATGLPDLVATDGDAYVELLARLTDTHVSIENQAEQLAARSEELRLCRDGVAACEALGLLLERAHDDLQDTGDAFRRARDPYAGVHPDRLPDDCLREATALLEAKKYIPAIRMAAEALCLAPGKAAPRRLLGKLHLTAGNVGRAVDFLVSAVQLDPASSDLWYDLAVALRRKERPADVVQALETCLHLNPQHQEALRMVAEMAESIGAHELAADALTALEEPASVRSKTPSSVGSSIA